MNTAFAARFAASTASEQSDTLQRHLETCLAELWADLPAPVWVADTSGRIVYVNRTADRSCNGDGRRQAAARIAEALRGRAAGAPEPCHSDRPVIDVSPLIDGCGQRVGWLAIGAPRR